MRELKTYNKRGFSLAEVLVTLTLLGVIAAVVIPGLVTRQHDRTTVAKLKKAYELIDNAMGLAIVDNGHFGSEATVNNSTMMQTIEPYLKTAAKCITSNSSTGPCNSKIQGIPAVLLKDGVSFSLPTLNSNSCSSVVTTGFSVCGTGLIDIDGTSGANQMGLDVFVFYVTAEGIVPFGMSNHVSGTSTNNGVFETKCLNATGDNRTGCAGWVIYNENLDYLKCSGLSWAGSHKCN